AHEPVAAAAHELEPVELPAQLGVAPVPVVPRSLALPGVGLLDAGRRRRRGLDRDGELDGLDDRQLDVAVPLLVASLAAAPAPAVAEQTELPPPAHTNLTGPLARLAGDVARGRRPGVGSKRRTRRRVWIVERVEQQPDPLLSLGECQIGQR